MFQCCNSDITDIYILIFVKLFFSGGMIIIDKSSWYLTTSYDDGQILTNPSDIFMTRTDEGSVLISDGRAIIKAQIDQPITGEEPL